MSRFNVVLTHDAQMRHLKNKWFDVNQTTDVIAFASDSVMKNNNNDLIGEIIVNEDEVKRNAQSFGVSFEQEMARVVAHGVLHIYGYEDDSAEGKAAMSAIEDAIVSKGTYIKE